MSWWSWLFEPVRLRRAAPLPAAQPAPQATPTEPAEDDASDPMGTLLAWLLHAGLSRGDEITRTEQRGVQLLDAMLDVAQAPTELLPRAPAVIPQLLSLLRQEDASLPAMADRVAKDVVLTAEVLRQAGNAAYNPQGTVSDVKQALALLGVNDLKAVIARVVLRPIFSGHAGPMSERTAARVWEHAECQAQYAAEMAAKEGLDRFDAYLGGLIHSTGWTVAFRTLDRLEAPLALPLSRPFAHLLLQRKDALFGKVVAGWQLTPALTAMSTQVWKHGLMAAAQDPLGAVLIRSQRRAAMDVLRRAAAPSTSSTSSTSSTN